MADTIQPTKGPEYGAMRDLLLELRRRAEAGDAYHPAETVKLIDALFTSDVRYLIRSIIGDTSLTARQWNIMEFVYRYRQQHDACPSYQEIGDSLGVSKVTIHEHVNELLAKGVLSRFGGGNGGRHRSLVISRPPPRLVQMPGRTKAADAWSRSNANW